MKRGPIISVLSALLIVLWVYAAFSKLIEFSVFKAQLEMQPLPGWAISILRWILPIVEIIVAVLLSIKGWQYSGLVASSLLMIVFTIYVFLALTGSFGDIPCSCAGIISKLHWKGHLVFNLNFLLVSVLGTYLKRQELQLDYCRKPTMKV